MIRVTYFIVCLLLGITLVSCIRDEALNAEADILTCTVPGDILKRDPKHVFTTDYYSIFCN